MDAECLKLSYFVLNTSSKINYWIIIVFFGKEASSGHKSSVVRIPFLWKRAVGYWEEEVRCRILRAHWKCYPWHVMFWLQSHCNAFVFYILFVSSKKRSVTAKMQQSRPRYPFNIIYFPHMELSAVISNIAEALTSLNAYFCTDLYPRMLTIKYTSRIF